MSQNKSRVEVGVCSPKFSKLGLGVDVGVPQKTRTPHPCSGLRDGTFSTTWLIISL